MGSILINSFTAPVGVTADIYAADANGNNQELLPGVFSQIGFTDNDGNFSPYPVLFDILATSTVVSLTADCSNGCVLTFQQVCLPSFPTPTPTDLPPCYFAAVYSLNGAGNVLSYVDCNGSGTTYTSTTEGLVYLCMPFQNIFNADFSVDLDSGYDCYSIPGTSPLQWVGEPVPSLTPTPTTVTPTPTPTEPTITYETISFPYNWGTPSSTRYPVTLQLRVHPEYANNPISVTYNSGQILITPLYQVVNVVIPMTAASGTIVISAATSTPGVVNSIKFFQSLPFDFNIPNNLFGPITATTTELKKLSGADFIGMTKGVHNTGNIQQLSGLTMLLDLGLQNGDYTGDIQYLPDSLRTINFVPEGNCASCTPASNQNTVSGNIANLPTNIASVGIDGLNTITGNLSSLSSLFGNVTDNMLFTGIRFNGNNTITGDISNLPNVNTIAINNRTYTTTAINPYLTTLTGNTISGNLTLKSRHSFVTIGGGNTITGNLSATQTPTSLGTLIIAGKNTIGGNVNLLKLPNTNFGLYGNNVVTGSINDIVVNPQIKQIKILNYGQYSDSNGLVVMTSGNTLSGNINVFQTCLDLRTLWIGGLNTITGDISSLLPLASSTSKLIEFWIVSPMNTINVANFVTTSPRLFPLQGAIWTFVSNNSNNGMNATQVNKLLTYFDANVPTPTTIPSVASRLTIDGTAHAAPSGTGITAKQNLITKYFVITTN